MTWRNIRLVFLREVRDQLRDRRTLFMITVLPVLLYPMLGLGIVQMMLLFSEQQRVVVILNADELPTEPALLDENGFLRQWFDETSADASLLRLVVQHSSSGPDSREVSDHRGSDDRPRPGQRSDRELIQAAQAIAGRLSESDDAGKIREIGPQFTGSGFEVLMVVPDGYREAVQLLEQQGRRESAPNASVDAAPSISIPSLQVIRNSADDKSAMAFARVQRILQNWEDAVRRRCFETSGLPAELHRPAQLRWVELAGDEQVAASVWSKMFPALLVIMALTGAFYPAVDLGAGEKERGTMETLLISPAKRVELVLGKFATIMLFSTATALLNLLSMGITGRQMAAVLGDGAARTVSLDFPGATSLMWLVLLLLPLSSLFSALCLALATFARSTKEGQYYLTPLLMVVMGLTMFCLSPAVEMTAIYSVMPVVNVALLLKGMLLNNANSAGLLVYAIPVLISSIGYSVLALWWAIELYNSEDVLFREAEKFDLRLWLRHLLRTKDAVPAFPEAVFCFIIILMLQFVAMTYMIPDLESEDPGLAMMRLIVVQQLAMIACPAVFMGVLLTTSLRATFRLRMPTATAMFLGAGLACVTHPLSVELSQFLVTHGVFPELPESAQQVMSLMRAGDRPLWLLFMVFAVTPAVCEELAFRGFILSGLARGGRLAIAIGISSLMFGIVHMIPQQAFNAALLGLILGLLAIYSRSLFPAMAFHFANNAIATLHASEQGAILTDGVFLSRDTDGFVRYETPLLVICAIALFLMVLSMIRSVVRQQDAKRRGLVPGFGESIQHSRDV